jgi:hypothetical protein
VGIRELTITMASTRGLLERHAILSANMLSVVSDIPQTRLSAALRGATYLGCETEARLLTLTHRCLKIIEAILPLRIAPGDGATLKLLVQSNRSEDEIRTTILSLLESMDVPTERAAEAVNDSEHGGI